MLRAAALRCGQQLRRRVAPLAARSAAQAAAPLQTTNLDSWIRDNEASFSPPVMNKLMHRGQLSIMFVGGPNTRRDFHLEEGSEFFYQLKGNMELPIVHGGNRELINIREGDVFLLPSRIPHSPQRPERGSIGLVIERKRYEDEAPDGLRYYVNFDTCDAVLWERYFHCYDLGRDLVPVVEAFNESEEKRTGVPTGENVFADPPLVQDTSTVVPPPFNLNQWLQRNSDELDSGAALELFPGHPDGEFRVTVAGGPRKEEPQVWKHETWLYQLRGGAAVTIQGVFQQLAEGACTVVPPGVEYVVQRSSGSRGLVVTNDPVGNKK